MKNVKDTGIYKAIQDGKCIIKLKMLNNESFYIYDKQDVILNLLMNNNFIKLPTDNSISISTNIRPKVNYLTKQKEMVTQISYSIVELDTFINTNDISQVIMITKNNEKQYNEFKNLLDYFIKNYKGGENNE